MKQIELCTPEPTKIDLEKTEVNSYAPSVSTIVKSEQTVKERIQVEAFACITSISQTRFYGSATFIIDLDFENSEL